MAAAAPSLYKGREKELELDVSEALWFTRYYAVNSEVLSSVARKNPAARIKMVGI